MFADVDYRRIGTLFHRHRRQGVRYSKIWRQDCLEEINIGLLWCFHHQGNPYLFIYAVQAIEFTLEEGSYRPSVLKFDQIHSLYRLLLHHQ